jgi:hypothetical protein
VKLDIAKKDTTTIIAPGVIERNGNYIVCPECNNERSFLLTENKSSDLIKWRCPECGEQLGGVFQENGTIVKVTVKPDRKWILIEIDADCDPCVLLAFRPETIEEATRRTLDSEEPKIFSTPVSFTLEKCESNSDTNLKNIQQFKGR